MEYKPNEGRSNIQYIFHVFIKEDKKELKLYNALGVNTILNMESAIVGNLNYHYLKNHNFNKTLAKKQSDFLLNFSKDFDIQLDTMQYYFGSSHEEINSIKGLDFIIGHNGESFPSGKADPKNKIVYSFGLGEYYPHELIHVVLYKKYNNMHFWFDEGIATYFGMSRGKELDWHLKKVNTFLQSHQEIDLNDLLKYRIVDPLTDFKYALGGFLIKYAYEKGGYELIKKLLLAGSSETEFYEAIKTHLELDKNSLNSFIRNELKKRYDNK